MRDRALYARILNLSELWIVSEVELDLVARMVVVQLGRRAGAALSCPERGGACPGYDAQPRRWRRPASSRRFSQAVVPRRVARAARPHAETGAAQWPAR